MQKLSEIIQADNIALDVDAQDFFGCLSTLVDRLVNRGTLSTGVGGQLGKALQTRENLSATCIGRGVVIPHAYVEGMPQSLVLFARLRQPVDYGAPDGHPVDLVFLLAGPAEAQRGHLPMLARLVRLLHDEGLLHDLRAADSPEDVLHAVREVESRHA